MATSLGRAITPRFATIGTSTDVDGGDVQTATDPISDSTVEGLVSNQAPPQVEGSDDPQPSALPGGRRRRRRRLWGGIFAGSRVPFVPDRASIHYATMLVRVCELCEKHSVGEVFHKLRNLRCNDGSPFLCTKWLEDPDGTFFGFFSNLEKVDLLNLRDGHLVYELLRVMKKLDASHFVAKFHSMMSMPESMELLPDIRASDRFVFSTVVHLSHLPGACFEEVFRVRLALCRAFGFQQHLFQFRSWKDNTRQSELILHWQIPYAYYDHMTLLLSREVRCLIQDGITNVVLYTEKFRAAKLSPRDLFLLVRSLHKTGTIGNLPTCITSPSNALAFLVEFKGSPCNYLVWKKVSKPNPYHLPSADPQFVKIFLSYLHTGQYEQGKGYENEVDVVCVAQGPDAHLGEKLHIPFDYQISCPEEMRVLRNRLLRGKTKHLPSDYLEIRITSVDVDGRAVSVCDSCPSPTLYVPEWSNNDRVQVASLHQSSPTCSVSLSGPDNDSFHDALSTFSSDRRLADSQPSSSRLTEGDNADSDADDYGDDVEGDGSDRKTSPQAKRMKLNS